MTDRSVSRCMMGHAPATAEENRTMHMALKTRRWTRADLDRLPEDGNTYEVVRGDLFVTPPPRVDHELIVGRLMRRIAPYVWSHDLGDVQTPHAVMIFEGSQVEPDLIVRPPIGKVDSWERMPTPFLVVEVLSDSTARRDRVAKRALYLDAGVAEYWMVDAERKSVTVARRGVPDVETTGNISWQPIAGIEPLTFDVNLLFA